MTDNKTFEKMEDVVISSRVRLARNLKKYPFPSHLNSDEKKEVNELVKDAIIDGKSWISKQFDYIDMGALSDIEAVELAEQRLISPEFAGSRNGRGLLLTKDKTISIMLNEEDHIRIQAIKDGLSLTECYSLAENIDKLLDNDLEFAFDDSLGFLTECPTNLGTGLRASVMLHLPALNELKQISKLSNAVSKLGLAIRGSYGEGSEAQCAFYQLSNQVTLGISEQTAVDNLNNIARQIIDQERSARKELIKIPGYEDRIYRSYGIMLKARMLNSGEFMEMASLVRVGSAEGLIDVDLNEISSLIKEVQPATLSSKIKENDAQARDRARATMTRERLNKEMKSY